MPELPEVETVVRALRPLLVGRTIKSFSTDWEKQIKTHTLVSCLCFCTEFAFDSYCCNAWCAVCNFLMTPKSAMTNAHGFLI